MLPKKVKDSGKEFREFHMARVNQRLERDLARLDL